MQYQHRCGCVCAHVWSLYSPPARAPASYTYNRVYSHVASAHDAVMAESGLTNKCKARALCLLPPAECSLQSSEIVL